jgi:hypothetical protein
MGHQGIAQSVRGHGALAIVDGNHQAVNREQASGRRETLENVSRDRRNQPERQRCANLHLFESSMTVWAGESLQASG